MKPKILHYVVRPEIARCHHIFIEDQTCEHHWIIPPKTAQWFIKLIPVCQLTKINDVKLDNKIIDIINNNIKPNIILFSDYKINERFLKTLSEKYQLWLINHGIWCPGILNRRENNKSQYPYLKYFHKIFYTPLEASFIKPFVNNEILCITNGYIGLDIIETLQKTHKNDKILIIANKAGFDNINLADNNKTFIEFEQILNVVDSFGKENGYQIVCKMKPTRNLETLMNTRSKIYKQPHITKISGQELIYQHLIDANIVIIQGYSTTFIESLYLNKPTIIAQIPKGVDFLNLNDYPNLLQVNNISELRDTLNLIHKEQIHLKEPYQIDRQKYLDVHLGNPIESLMQKICKYANDIDIIN